MQGRCNSDPNSRSVTILITDSCPECEGDHLDIQVRFYRVVLIVSDLHTWPCHQAMQRGICSASHRYLCQY